LNHLEAVRQTSRYIDEPHLVILLDGEPLDQWFARLAGSGDFSGLVTTLTDWLPDPAERAVVWNRILPRDGKTEMAPILVCPDDLDFFCTVGVVEAARESDIVFWRRFGLDLTDAPDPEQVGSNVEWFMGDRHWQFDLQAYRHFLQACRDLNID
jgi:hypothetical protein